MLNALFKPFVRVAFITALLGSLLGLASADTIEFSYDDSGNVIAITRTGTTYALTVTKSGTGSGTVTSNPAGINCGSDCTETYASGTAVTLTAAPAAGSTFTGWSGACTGTGACSVTMSATKSVTATFTTTAATYALTVTKNGTGSGTVTSNPAGINCGSDCTETYANGTAVTLTAAPAAGSIFTGWSGACTGTGACSVTMSATKSVTATFTTTAITYALTVTKNGTGSGTVTSNPAGINCGSDCTETYASGTVVALTAAPATNSTFVGWSGACSGTGACSVTMTAAKSVSASFTNSDSCGANWQLVGPLPLTNGLQGVIYSGEKFVAVGDGTVLTSPDGSTWTPHTTNTALWGIAWNGSLFAAGGYGPILTSPDGATWTSRTSGTTSWFRGVTWSGSQFVAVGRQPTSILTSPDGMTWTSRTPGTTAGLDSVTWGESQFLAVGDSGTILTSPDGITWTSRTSGTTNRLLGVTWGGGLFVAVGESGTILTSPDGASWTARTSGTTMAISGMAWGNNLFVAVTWNGGPILTSPDGVVWTPHPSGLSATSSLHGVTWNGTQFVAVGRNGTILRSDCGSGPPLCQGTALNLDTPKLITGTESLGSQVSITTTNSYQVQAGGNLTFTAPKISLGPGFRVALGGLFHATPQACAP